MRDCRCPCLCTSRCTTAHSCVVSQSTAAWCHSPHCQALLGCPVAYGACAPSLAEGGVQPPTDAALRSSVACHSWVLGCPAGRICTWEQSHSNSQQRPLCGRLASNNAEHCALLQLSVAVQPAWQQLTFNHEYHNPPLSVAAAHNVTSCLIPLLSADAPSARALTWQQLTFNHQHHRPLLFGITAHNVTSCLIALLSAYAPSTCPADSEAITLQHSTEQSLQAS